MKSYLTHIGMLFLGAAIMFVVMIAVSLNTPDNSPALRGCEVTAATVEKELQECRWSLQKSKETEDIVIERCKQIIMLIMECSNAQEETTTPKENPQTK
jgi:hypothetical protein